jgi:hypothetical protein
MAAVIELSSDRAVVYQLTNVSDNESTILDNAYLSRKKKRRRLFMVRCLQPVSFKHFFFK